LSYEFKITEVVVVQTLKFDSKEDQGKGFLFANLSIEKHVMPWTSL